MVKPDFYFGEAPAPVSDWVCQELAVSRQDALELKLRKADFNPIQCRWSIRVLPSTHTDTCFETDVNNEMKKVAGKLILTIHLFRGSYENLSCSEARMRTYFSFSSPLRNATLANSAVSLICRATNRRKCLLSSDPTLKFKSFMIFRSWSFVGPISLKYCTNSS